MMTVGSMRTYLAVVALLLCAIPAWTGQLSPDGREVFVGEITDSFCARNGSHDELMNEFKSMGRDKKTCTLKCLNSGAKLVLYDSSRHTIYTLKDSARAVPFMGEKVRITGSLHKHELAIDTIENMK